MRFACRGMGALLGLALTFTAGAGPQPADPDDVRNVFKSLRALSAAEPVRSQTTEEGYLTFLGAPDGGYFEPGSTGKSVSPEAHALSFVAEHLGAFGMKSANVGFQTKSVKRESGRNYVRIQQTYKGTPVFAGEMIVQLSDNGEIACVVSDILRDPSVLDSRALSLSPSITAAEAQNYAIAAVQAEHPGAELTATAPALYIYDPVIVGNIGGLQLVWALDVTSGLSGGEPVGMRVLVDAHDGGIAFDYSLVCNILQRFIYDADGVYIVPGLLVRAEGNPPTGIADADKAYDFFADIYNFYNTYHDYKSYDNEDSPLVATVRLPFNNAFWVGDLRQMLFGLGFTVDDVTAHEVTHGVTDTTSKLIYENESGAINESFSDIWGEFIDIENNLVNPEPNRWLIAEDITGFGPIRSMKDPPSVGFPPSPDRYNSPFFYRGPLDNGGVHINSGIGNKLAYLLVDGSGGEPGGEFNGFVIQPMGIRNPDPILNPPGVPTYNPRVAELFFECQTNLLTPGANYFDLGAALLQSAKNLDMSPADQLNVLLGVLAVEILPFSQGTLARAFRATPQGNNVLLTWSIQNLSNVASITIVRKQGSFALTRADLEAVQLFSGLNTSFTDTTVTPGQEYYYTAFVELAESGAPTGITVDYLFARVTAGAAVPDYLTQRFFYNLPFGDPSSIQSLQFKQLYFSPVSDLVQARLSGNRRGYVNYTNYVGQVSSISEFPVSPQGQVPLPPSDDGLFFARLIQPFPYFGGFFNNVLIGANGFIVSDAQLAATVQYTVQNLVFPTLSNHFNVPRISLLFSDLASNSAGKMWYKIMEDRAVLTIDGVPEFGSLYPNSAQVELFYSGHIRMSFLELNTSGAITGLSDGLGSPPGFTDSNLLNLPAPGVITLDPIPTVFATEGDLVTFDINANTPAGGTVAFEVFNTPAAGAISLTQIDANTARFEWQTVLGSDADPAADPGSAGVYTVLFCGRLGQEAACIEVTMYITGDSAPPVVSNLQIHPSNPVDSDSLILTYDYSHVGGLPEGATKISWFKDNSLIVAVYGQRVVPPLATRPGERWYATVQPETIAASLEGGGIDPVVGAGVTSPEVVISAGAKADVNHDGKINSTDIQLVILAALDKLDLKAAPVSPDVNRDGYTTSIDVQLVINEALK